MQPTRKQIEIRGSEGLLQTLTLMLSTMVRPGPVRLLDS